MSLCSLRSLRASMYQLFKIHKARGECQERTIFNVPINENSPLDTSQPEPTEATAAVDDPLSPRQVSSYYTLTFQQLV